MAQVHELSGVHLERVRLAGLVTDLTRPVDASIRLVEVPAEK